MDRKQYLAKENVESIWELSLLQQEMFHQLESSENNANHILRMVFTINGRLEVDKIQEAWKQTIRQTPLLRTVFRSARNRTVQVVLKEYPNPVEIPDEKDDRGEESAKHFNLKEETAIRMKLIQNTHDEAIFSLSVHPIILDKKSLISVLEDFLALYDSLLKNKALLSPRRPPFKNYLDWLDQQYWLPGVVYWEKELVDFISPTSLVRYQRYSQEGGRTGSAPHLDLPETPSRQLQQCCQQEGFSPDILVQAAWALVLNLYTGEKDIYFGVELQGRPGGIPDYQNVLGPFANILPLRVTIRSQQTPREFIKEVEVKNHRLGQYPYISLQEIHAKLGLPPGAKLFESSVHVNPWQVPSPGEVDTPRPAHIDIRQDYLHSFALEVFTGKTWRLRLFSFKEVLSEAAALQVLKILALLLERIAKNPGTRLSQLDYLSAEAWEKLGEINRPDIQLPVNCLETFMHRVFEQQVEKRPDTIACTHENHQVSYLELNQWANRLTHWLKQQGIDANHLVGIFCQRSIEMLTAIIAIFKAGGAYIPLDPANPDSRLKTILVDSGVQVIFTRTPELERILRLVKGLPFSKPAPLVFCLDSLPGETTIPHAAVLETYSTVNPPLNNRPRDAAYVFFTSGSTGIPKGAVVEYIGMVNHLWTKIRLLQLSHTSKVVQNASHCFDISVWQFLAALMTGGQTIIYSNEIAMNPSLLMKSSGINRAAILEMVPAVMEMALAQDTGSGDSHQTPLPHLKYLLSTGEALSTALCQKWLEKYPHIPVVNAYGPTECSDDTHHRIISPANPLQDYYNDVPLGRIIPNFRGYVLGESRRPLPPGGVGEICLTGTGVGKGYLNDPERTAEAFVKNPFPDGMGTRMYRTGDMGYFDIRGQLVFLGRIDHQVKVRGFRIELGEIETQLRNHPAVKQCVTVIRKDAANQNQIIAYVVLKKGILARELGTYLEELLPGYMIPGHILELEELPLNRSGKIDRKALPDPDQVIQSLDPTELPKTHIEKTVVQIWEEVLEISPIGVNHNFFQLGGHSLQIIRVRSRINQLLGVDVSIIELFRKPTVGQLAQLLEGQLAGAAGPQRPAIDKAPETPYYPMSHAQQRLFFLQQIEPDSTGYNLSTVIESRQPLHLEYLKKAIQTITDRQATLRTTFGITDNKPVQYVAREYEASFKLEDFSQIEPARQGQMLAEHLEKEANSRFDLTKGPLFYTIVYKLDEKRHLLFFHMHHIITDLWSWEIFFKELYTLYQSYIQDREVSLPHLHIQYTDYAAWQNKRIENGDFQVHADYWKEQLAGELPVLELPLDFPRPVIQKFRGGAVSGNIPVTSVRKLHQLFRKKNVTSFIGLLAVFYAFLARITGQQDIIAGTVAAGRDHVELENLIGFFVNTLPIRVDMGGAPCFTELLHRVKEVSLAAYEHAQYPFDLIIAQLNLERDLSRHPLFSVMFQVNEERGGDANPHSNPGLMMKQYGMPKTTINFDFHVIFTEYNENLVCNFFYCKDLFKEETIKRWQDHFFVLLEALIAAPETRISSANILTRQQKEQLLIDWNNTHVHYQGDQSVYVHTMFENRVEKTPGAAALVFADQTITYRQLNRQVNQLSYLLDEKGVLPGAIVGIHMERCLNIVVAMLGILKAGAVYMPLDPALPMERRQYMISDSNTSLLVASPLHRDQLKKEFPKTDRLCIRETGPASYPGENRLIPCGSGGTGSTAYIIYTSGSTGIPKGVRVSHLPLTNFIHAMTAHFFSENDIMLAVTNFTFDISFLELVLPLTTGCQVVLASEEEIRNGELLRNKLEAACVTIMQGTPATWKLLLQSGWQGTPYLKSLIGGEALSLELARAVVKKCRSLWNMYGPTEAAIWASFAEIPVHVRSITIGRPIFNTQMYILNPALNPVPLGVTGELYIGGKCLAQGYVNAPELTAKAFISSPFDGNNKSKGNGKNRLYKTGDLVRYRDDGNIEFLGRQDHQVKIRGYRIELREIENHLLKKDNIKEAVILVKRDKHNEKFLCAYIVSDNTAAPDNNGADTVNAAELGEYLAARLPHYMVPAQFIKVHQLPLTPSGKIDRKALTGIGEIIGTGVEYQPPGNIIEKVMANIWKDVLEVETVSINDNFFQLGGHSLKAVKLISKLEENDIHISINELFKYQNIKELAQYIMDIAHEDVYLVKTPEEAVKIFENRFNAKAEWVTYHIDSQIYHVFYTEDELQMEYRQIAHFFGKHLHKELYPHFIKPLSQKPDLTGTDIRLDHREFSEYLHLQRETPAVQETGAAVSAQLKKAFTRFNETIVNNKTIKQYPPAPIQQGFRVLNHPVVRRTIWLDKPLDVSLLEEALQELIKNQGLLRSILKKKNGEWQWNEFQSPDRITIPYVDLMDYDPRFKEQLISEILKQMKTRDSRGNCILYKLVLFKKDLRNHLLVMDFDHTIFDGMSGEIIERNLLGLYRLREKNQGIRQPEPQSYSDYIRQVLMGPQDIEQDELIKMFSLKEFCESKRKFEKIIKEKESDKVKRLYYEVGFPEGATGENAWELAFLVFNLFLKRYFGLAEIPVKLVSYGRRYGQNDFFDTVGAFLDIVPLLVHVNEKDPANMIEDALDKMKKAAKHNINFISMMYDRSLKEEWKTAAELIIPEQLPTGDMMILFNFAGKISEEEMAQLKRRSTGTANSLLKISSFHAEVYYTPSTLYFIISTSLDIEDTAGEIKISAEELKKIMKKSEGV